MNDSGSQLPPVGAHSGFPVQLDPVEDFGEGRFLTAPEASGLYIGACLTYCAET